MAKICEFFFFIGRKLFTWYSENTDSHASHQYVYNNDTIYIDKYTKPLLPQNSVSIFIYTYTDKSYAHTTYIAIYGSSVFTKYYFYSSFSLSPHIYAEIKLTTIKLTDDRRMRFTHEYTYIFKKTRTEREKRICIMYSHIGPSTISHTPPSFPPEYNVNTSVYIYLFMFLCAGRVYVTRNCKLIDNLSLYWWREKEREREYTHFSI